jgi:hypothetical protein
MHSLNVLCDINLADKWRKARTYYLNMDPEVCLRKAEECHKEVSGI